MQRDQERKENFPTFEYEKLAALSGHLVVGIDEAGRGPLAGPVVAAAAWYRSSQGDFPRGEERYTRLIRDSKTLSGHQREEAYRWIVEHFEIGVGSVDAETIDRVNILQATFLAMREAVSHITDEKRQTMNERDGDERSVLILVDGNRVIPDMPCKQEAIVKGDARSVSIAAASIVAKVTRDRMMCDMDRLYPEYGFLQHKGYGTAQHIEVLRRFGPCPIHRQSFAPVAKAYREFARKEES